MAKEPKMKIGIGADTGDFEKGSKRVKQALKELGVDANSASGSIVASMGKAAVAFAGVFAAVNVVINAVKDLKDQNQVLGDTWDRTCEGMTAAMDTVKTSIASLDFTNIISNMSEANRLARELYEAMDAMGEIGTAYNIALAQQLGKIDELRLKMKDTSLSEQERVAAGQELLKIYEQLEKNPTRGLGRVSDTTIDYYMQRMGIELAGRTDEQLSSLRKQYLDFFKWLGTEEAEAYLEAAEQVNKRGGINGALGQRMISNAAYKGMAEYARLAIEYSAKMGDKDREKLEQAVVAYLQQENKYAQETFRIRKDIQTIQNESDAAAAAAAEAARNEMEAAAAAAKAIADSRASLTEWRGAAGSVSPLITGATVQVPTELAKPENVEEWRWDVVASIGDIHIGIALDVDTNKIIDVSRELEGIANSMAANIGEAFGTLFADLATGENAWGNFANAAISAFGDMAVSVGKIAIEMGLASEGIKAALHLGDPWVAIAAGVALVALGTAVKAGLANVAGGNYSASAGVATSGSYSASNSYETRDVNVHISGQLRADGDQLVAVINNTTNRNGYTT